jgi:hypothetical protein
MLAQYDLGTSRLLSEYLMAIGLPKRKLPSRSTALYDENNNKAIRPYWRVIE